jgi:uncharacterized OB-fold protein
MGGISVEGEGELRLVGVECNRCRQRAFPPAKLCSNCLSEDLRPVELGSEGTLYSYSVVHAAPRGWSAPYVIGYVDLPDGVRVFGHVAARPEELRMDAKVRLRAADPDEEAGAPVDYRFVPVEQEVT